MEAEQCSRYFQIFPELLRQPFLFVLGLLATVGVGIVVDRHINSIVAAFRGKIPPGVSVETWGELLQWPKTYGGVVLCVMLAG